MSAPNDKLSRYPPGLRGHHFALNWCIRVPTKNKNDSNVNVNSIERQFTKILTPAPQDPTSRSTDIFGTGRMTRMVQMSKWMVAKTICIPGTPPRVKPISSEPNNGLEPKSQSEKSKSTLRVVGHPVQRGPLFLVNRYLRNTYIDWHVPNIKVKGPIGELRTTLTPTTGVPHAYCITNKLASYCVSIWPPPIHPSMLFQPWELRLFWYFDIIF